MRYTAAKFIEIESRRVVARVSAMGMWELLFHGYNVSARKDEKSSRSGLRQWLHNNVKVCNITELCT